MSPREAEIADFLARHDAVMRVEVSAVRGSAPREAGAFMLVSAKGAYGTIGGGALEFQMIGEARRYLRSGKETAILSIPLGPGIGQCCGGHVEIGFDLLNDARAATLLGDVRQDDLGLRAVYVFGAGHVGLALARALAPLPFRPILVDTRPSMLKGFDGDVETRLTPIPEAEVDAAPAGSVFIAVTHDHALDFLITGAALRRADSAYVGMIGSHTKRMQFKHWFLENGGDEHMLASLVSPIGDSGVQDKRPEIIAALTIAEIIVKMDRQPSKWAVPHAALETTKGSG